MAQSVGRLKQVIQLEFSPQARKIRWHGSVGRAHRSHRWGRWFESNCHHHSEALVDQGLPLFLSPGITAEGFTFFRVHFGDVNSSGRHSVHTVVWLSCRKIGVALLVESGKKASPKRCSGDALNLNNSPYCQAEIVDLQQLFSPQALGISTDKLRLWAFFCIKCSQIALDKFRKHNVVLYEVTCAHP